MPECVRVDVGEVVTLGKFAEPCCDPVRDHRLPVFLDKQEMREVGQVMSTYVGIVRSDLRLRRAWERLDLLYEETEDLFKRVKATKDICELRNMINVGYLITRQALERKESRGLHYTIDYPKKKDTNTNEVW